MPSDKFSLNIKNKIAPFNKTINIDSDKSISIRSFLIGAISENISTIKNVLESEDVISSINCLKSLVLKLKKWNLRTTIFIWLGSYLLVKKNWILEIQEL